MNYRKFSVFIALFLLGLNTVYGSGPTYVKQFINHADWNFVENKGQIPLPPLKKGESVSNNIIKYYGHQGGVYLYCKPGMISFVFTKTVRMDPFGKNEPDQISEASSQPVETQCLRLAHASAIPHPPVPQDAFNASLQKQITTSRADLVLFNSNPNAQIIASDQQEYYENYYTTGNADSGITNVHTYKTITYKSIYPNIDLVLHACPKGMKYEFVVYPGGEVSDIQMDWRGLESIIRSDAYGKKLSQSDPFGKDSKIEYSCSLGKMTESAPYTYQCASNVGAGLAPAQSGNIASEKGDRKGRPYMEIPSHFILKNNRIGFTTGKYDKTKTLVIDPTLEWGTYFGGSGADQAWAVTTDASRNVYITGFASSSNNIASSGTYQTSYSGDQDAFLAKFNSSGHLLWATYYGGSSDEQGTSVSVDPYGNVYMTGWTGGSAGMATIGAYQTVYQGGLYDAFLAKFNSTGTLLWGTYLGGDGEDWGYGVSSDPSGDVYITGWTTSDHQIATSGAYQTLYTKTTSNIADGFIAKFNSLGNILWATYYGGTEENWPAGIKTDFFGNVYITGWTTSTSGIATNGTYQTSFAGGYDAFLAKFSSSGNLDWGTYFGGSEVDDGFSISTNAQGDIYMTGFTESTSGIATAGAYQTSNGGVQDAFLAKFDSSGNLYWATYYGGSSKDYGYGVSIDGSGNANICGITGSGDGIATAGTYQTSLRGNYDAFVAKFNSLGGLIWGTYYGDGFEYGLGLSTDALENIYVAGSTESNSGMATPNAYQTIYGGGGDAFLAKFRTYQYDAGITAIAALKDSSCPGNQLIKIKFKDYGYKTLDSVHIGFSVNGKVQSNYKWTGKLLQDSVISFKLGNYNFQSGSDTVRVWTSYPNGVLDSFPGNDTAISIVYVSALPSATAGPDTTLCYNEIYTMQGAGGITYLWTPAKYLSNDTIAAPKAELPNTQLYTLYVHNKYGCEDSANVLLTVKPKLQVKIGFVASPVCYGSSVSLSAIGTGGDSAHYSYSWPNDSMQGNSVNLKIYKAGWHKVVLSDNCSGLPGLDSVYIEVIPAPKADFTILNRHPYLPDTAFRFQNQSTNASKYLWTFGDSTSSTSSDTAAYPVHVYTDSGTYKITLVAFGKCSNDTGYGYIHIFSKYINIFIPDAFSPNNDGINNVLI